MNSVLEVKDEVLANLKALLTSLADNAEYEQQIAALADSQERRSAEMRRLLRETNGTGAAVDEARVRYEQMDHEYNDTDAEISRLSEELTQRKRQHSRTYRYIESLKRQEPLEDFPEAAFQALIDYATVYPDYRIVFMFKDGHEVTVEV